MIPHGDGLKGKFNKTLCDFYSGFLCISFPSCVGKYFVCTGTYMYW